MKKLSRELTLLYPLRRPFTSVAINPEDAPSDYMLLSLDINRYYAGTLRIPAMGVERFLLSVLADTNHPVGHIYDGKVEWVFEPEVFDFTDVISDDGEILLARTLPR